MPSALSTLVILHVGPSIFVQVWPPTAVLLPMPPSNWDCRCIPPYKAYLLRWSLLTFCLSWPQTAILFMSASRAAGDCAWPQQLEFERHWKAWDQFGLGPF
jgi:hypothetical protein